MNDYILEVCVDSAESALAAAKGGASRLELCQNLVIGGTTPGSKLFEVIRRQTTIPIHALTRPRFGDFCYTPYELEEIREREERKDRLHQNYLKRKASGAQKRYEDKIKGRKKAEIEAKKAAIRAEDIAKGVFVPVSSLPQREPMKGVQTA